MIPRYIDVHSHISFPEFESDYTEVLLRMREASVYAFTVGTDAASSRSALAFAAEHDGVFATIGLHPTDTRQEAFNETAFTEMAAHPKTVAIGECGLDYYRGGESAEDVARQKDSFEKQIEFAVANDKPLMVHCRDAHEDALSLLTSKKKEYGARLRGNIHFFTATAEVARQYFDLEFTVSLTGVVTFSRQYDAIITESPLSMLLSETDAPYAAPVPYRGKRNEPMFVREVVQTIAKIRNEPLETVADTLVGNARRVFTLPF